MVRVGSSDRPWSMYMMCPDEVGRDSGDRGGQESEVFQDWKSHQELGEKPSPRELLSGLKRNDPRF